MGRKPIGEKAPTKAQKQRRYHQKLSAGKEAKIAKEDKEQKKLKRALINLDADKYTDHNKKQRADKKWRRD